MCSSFANKMEHLSQAEEEVAVPTLDFHERWVWISQWIVRGGVLLGVLAKLTLGREFMASDPWIGPILIPLAVIWVLAFAHLLYTRLRGQLSAPVRWLGLATIALFASILIWAMFFGGTNQPKIQNNGEQAVPPNGP
jgi:hypothetical protein